MKISACWTVPKDHFRLFLGGVLIGTYKTRQSIAGILFDEVVMHQDNDKATFQLRADK